MAWTLAPSAQLQWRSWDGETVVFHPPSGDTHILHPLAAEALRLLDHHALDTTKLTATIAEAFGLQLSDELHQQVDYCIKQFSDLGIIIHVPD